ncbi:MAG: RibD family protein [Hyphomonadaceae bacterium]|nr:RibD family protein [Hyphomonadaceae bacterium]MBC6411726.1 RibD family protein [Hyphomonadaceae bacterium]
MLSRPKVTLKLATSLDGKIALANGDSEWITGRAAREAGRRLRGSHDAICVGANTAIIDNPQLTARIHGLSDPVRVIFDSRLRLLPESNLVQTAEATPLWIFCCNHESKKADTLKSRGVTLLPVFHDNGLSIEAALDMLFRRHIKTLLLEGGGQLTAGFLRLGVIDRIEWFRAPIILGGDGRSGIGNLGIEDLDMAHTFNRVSVEGLGRDVHEVYERII